ncbi:hypothetical protein D1007_60959 [Hordeum vulgare]|nr:hypothetical protein D1007_60959 [Hordeum vulgare]
MCANEQSLWYFKRLCAKAEEMNSMLGVAIMGDLPMVTPLTDPTASTTTHASSAPVPDISGSITKAQEVLEVIHDTPPDCITMAHNTCLTECSHLVATTNIVNQVRDATTAIFPMLAVDIQHALYTTVHVAKGLGQSNSDSEFDRTIGTPSLMLSTTLMPLLPTASLAPVIDSAHRVIDNDSIMRVPLAIEDVLLLTQPPSKVAVVTSLQLLMNHDLDVSLRTKCSEDRES